MKKGLISSLALLAALVFSFQSASAGESSGLVVGWGENIAGEATGVPTGNPPSVSNTSTGVVTISGRALDHIIAIAAGNAHSLALMSDGTVFGWGNNTDRQAIGSKSESSSSTSGQVKIDGKILKGVCQIAAGANHSLALTTNGTIIAWGNNQFGQARMPTGVSNVVAIAAGGNHSVALAKDGVVTSWGIGNKPPLSLSNVVAISASGYWDAGCDLALRRDGTVVAWALRGSPRELPAQANLDDVVAIAAGWNHSLALRRDGTVVGWGNNSASQATGTQEMDAKHLSSGTVSINGEALTDVVAIAAGNEFSLALKRDGKVVLWGRPPFYKDMSVPADLRDTTAIAAGENFCLAVITNTTGLSFRK